MILICSYRNNWKGVTGKGGYISAECDRDKTAICINILALGIHALATYGLVLLEYYYALTENLRQERLWLFITKRVMEPEREKF